MPNRRHKVPRDTRLVRTVSSTYRCTALRAARHPWIPACCILASALVSFGIGRAAEPGAPSRATKASAAEKQPPGLRDEARAPLSFSDKLQVVRWLRRGAHAKPALDNYWDEYSRFERGSKRRPSRSERDVVIGAAKARSIGRKWFFPRGEVGEATAAFIDLHALGFQYQFRSATRYRVLSILRAPLTDVTELRLRQEAIAELMAQKPGVAAQLAKIRENERTKEWMRSYFYDDQYHHPEPETAEVLYRTPADEQVRVGLKKKNDRVPFLESCMEEAERRRDFFRDVLKLAKALNTKDVRSTRLRQFGWVLKAIVGDDREGGAGKWIRRFIAAEDQLEHYDLIDEAENPSTRLGRRIELLREVVSEVLMYAELADHAVQRKWTVFPKVLDPEKEGRPVLRIIGGHAPRVWMESLKDGPESVPNSIELGVGGKRHALISGPNNQGKTTTLRMVGQLLTLAQMGLPVPAAKMEWTPMELNIFLRPKDDPANREGTFVKEVQEIWHGVLGRAKKNPFQLVIMDESATGTIEPVREDFAADFLRELDRTGVLSLYATHTLGTTKLGKKRSLVSRVLLGRKSNPFFNLHVDWYKLKPGPATNLAPFYEGLGAVLDKADVDPSFAEKLSERGRQRTERFPLTRLRQLWRAVRRR